MSRRLDDIGVDDPELQSDSSDDVAVIDCLRIAISGGGGGSTESSPCAGSTVTVTAAVAAATAATLPSLDRQT